MQITKYLYKRLQEAFPDLFVDAQKSQSTSTLFAEFLPAAALSNPCGSPWGQYGNREIPPKRKTVVISFKDLENKPFSELEKMDEAARFLKRAGFDVLIPVGNELQDYDMQLFDRAHISAVGNKSRAEIQKMAIEKKISADELFFIDDVKKELTEEYVVNLVNQFQEMEKKAWADAMQSAYSQDYFNQNRSDVKKIANALQSGKCPTGLAINFSFNKIDSQGVQAIADALSSGKCPKGLYLCLVEVNAGFVDIKAIANALSSGKCPAGLIIDLRYNKTDESCTTEIVEALASEKCPRGVKIYLKHAELLESQKDASADHRKITKDDVAVQPLPDQTDFSDLAWCADCETLQVKLSNGKTVLTKNEYPKLHVLKIEPDIATLNIAAPKLTNLSIVINNIKFLNDIGEYRFLNRLEITYTLDWEDYLEPSDVKNENLIELYINGILSLNCIEKILENSPNLRRLELANTRITRKALDSLSSRFPHLVVTVISRFEHENLEELKARHFDLHSDSLSSSTTRMGSSDSNSVYQSAALQRSSSRKLSPATLSQQSQLRISDRASPNHIQRSDPPVPQPADHGKEDIIYTNGSANTLTSDFDTKHNPEKTFTMQQASKHLTISKPNRFQYTRDGIYQLDSNALFTPLEAHVHASYSLPEKNEKLPTDNTHDFYEFKNTLNLSSGETFRLTALSAQDVLFQLKLNGRSLTTEEVEITKDNLGFYYLKAKTRLHGNLIYVMDVPAEIKEAWNKLPLSAQEMIQSIQNFPSADVEALSVPNHATPAEKLDAMYDQGKAACRHRVSIFLHKLKKLKLEDPVKYARIEARGVLRGGVHANIEISVDVGKTWEVLELGGYEAKKQYPSITLPPIHFSSKKSVDAPKPNFINEINKIKDSRGQNTLLCLKDSSDIYNCLSHIRHTCHNRPIFYVDSPEQLRTSLRRLKLNRDKNECEMIEPPAGLLHDFLMTHQHTDPPPVIVINWENFTFSDMVQFNSVIDTDKRRVDNTPIPPSATIVGLHSRNEKMMDLLGDSSFVSRHATGGIHDFTAQTLPQQKGDSGAAKAAVGGVLKINLHQSPRWHDILIGKAYVDGNKIDGNKIKWKDGQLLKLLNNAGITHVELINPPVADQKFKNFVADLRAGLPLTLLNHEVPLGRKLIVNNSEKPSFTEGVAISITRVNHLVKDAYIINSATFEQCLHTKVITDDLMLAGMGLLETNKNEALTLCVCDNLSESQWSLMLEQAKKYNVTLNISVLPDVKIPAQISIQERTIPHPPLHPKKQPSGGPEIRKQLAAPAVPKLPPIIKTSTNRFIITNDVEYSVTQVQREFATPAKVIDLSEVGIDDLFCKVGYSIRPEGFRFTKQNSAIWQALQAGETIILKGYCSDDMLNYLASMMSSSPYFAFEGKKHTFPGKLIIVADKTLKPPAWLPAEIQTVTIAQKKEALGLAQDDRVQDKPFIQLQVRVPALDLAKSAPDDLSLEACEQFEKNRVEAVQHKLRFSPYALLEGPPGVGKSYFMRAFASDPAVRIYRENDNDIEKWATDQVPDGVQKILFRDEINLRGIDCSQDRDLLNDPPSIFVNGKYYLLTANCKIMYAQNPLDYGGERHEPKLFEDLPECKYTFDQMSKAFVLHRILKPIFNTTFDSAESLARATKILNENYASMRSIRDLQTKAIFECAKEKEKQRAMTAREEVVADPVNRRMICVGHHDFILTPSRYEPYQDVLTLLQARIFKRALPVEAPDGAKYNGTNGLVLQGPPGVGKSEFIEHVLNDEGYAEINSKTTPAQIESGKVYYRLRASVSNEQKLKILHEAFQKGAILIIDEIDSCPLLENYLNAYLVGEDIHGKRARSPGFTILSTANGASLKGRRELPAPLKSRMLALTFNEYPRDDLIQILNAKFIPPVDPNAAESSASIARQSIGKDMIVFMVDEFLTQQNTQQYDTPPTFRDLYIAAKDYFEIKFDRYAEMELSKDQHQFMLAYKDYSGIQALEACMILSKMTLPDMEKKLKKANKQFAFFKKREDGDAFLSTDSTELDRTNDKRH